MIKAENFLCVSCREFFLEFDDLKEEYFCKNCSSYYPLLNGNIPVIIQNNKNFLAQMFLQYNLHIKVTENKILRIEEEIANNHFRKNSLEQISKALQWNLLTIKSIKNSIGSKLSINDTTNEIDKKAVQQYLMDWTYLKRDWAGTDDGEKQIGIILTIIIGYLNDFVRDYQNCFFLGAGTGRFLWELSPKFKDVFAIDNSPTMVSLFNHLLKTDIDFFEIITKNLKKKKNTISKYTASLKNSKLSPSDIDNIHYFIGDASRVPFKSNGLSVVFSIFFSDVIPFQVLIKEVKRILKPGGIFIHFGPLDYHFDDIENMLTLEDIKFIIKINGFEILKENFTTTEIGKSDQSLSFKTYENWSFIAKNTESNNISIDNNSILSINSKISYTSKGIIDENGHEQQTRLNFQLLESYENAELVFLILKELDGVRSLGEIMERLKTEYYIDINLNNKRLYKIFEELTEYKAISIVD